MKAITVKRTFVRQKPRIDNAPAVSSLVRSYLTSERKIEFAIEVFFFGIIVAISVWPLFVAAGALGEFLQRAPI